MDSHHKFELGMYWRFIVISILFLPFYLLIEAVIYYGGDSPINNSIIFLNHFLLSFWLILFAGIMAMFIITRVFDFVNLILMIPNKRNTAKEKAKDNKGYPYKRKSLREKEVIKDGKYKTNG